MWRDAPLGIINPSDPYTLAGDDFQAVALAVLMLGEGRYAARELDGDREVPMFFFGGAEEWYTSNFSISLGDALRANPVAVADVLDSVMIGSRAERQSFEAALKHIPTEEGRSAYRAEVLDRQRSSTNNIGTRAWALAKRLRATA